MPEQEKEVAAPPQPSNWMEEAASKETEKPVETAPDPEPQAKEKVEERVEKVVPLAALHEERAKRREALARENAMREEIVQLRRQQLEIMQQRQQPAVAPDVQTDPLGALVHNQNLTQQQLKALVEQQQRQQQESTQRQQWDGFVNAVKEHEAAFVKEQPDAIEAIGFLKQSRVNEYKAGGLSHQEAVQRMARDELDLVNWAMQSGENPAKAAFDMAVSRGYVSPKAKLEMQAKGQKASMPDAGGKGGGNIPSLETLLKMDSKEFAKATEGENWAKLMKKHGA